MSISRAHPGGDPDILASRLDDRVAQETSHLQRGLATVSMLAAVAPLLGLLGTVTGMIATFQSITLFGTGNARGMADGISQALLTTMAGLVTALSGLFFSANLDARAEEELERFKRRLHIH